MEKKTGLITVSPKDFDKLVETCKKNRCDYLTDAKGHREKIILKAHPKLKRELPFEVSTKRYVATWDLIEKEFGVKPEDFNLGDSKVAQLAKKLHEEQKIPITKALNLAVQVIHQNRTPKVLDLSDSKTPLIQVNLEFNWLTDREKAAKELGDLFDFILNETIFEHVIIHNPTGDTTALEIDRKEHSYSTSPVFISDNIRVKEIKTLEEIRLMSMYLKNSPKNN